MLKNSGEVGHTILPADMSTHTPGMDGRFSYEHQPISNK